MTSSDGRSRDLVSTIPGAGWDFGLYRHPYHEIERPFGPRFTVYNRRLMACQFDEIDTEEGYWLLRQKALRPLRALIPTCLLLRPRSTGNWMINHIFAPVLVTRETGCMEQSDVINVAV